MCTCFPTGTNDQHFLSCELSCNGSRFSREPYSLPTSSTASHAPKFSFSGTQPNPNSSPHASRLGITAAAGSSSCCHRCPHSCSSGNAARTAVPNYAPPSEADSNASTGTAASASTASSSCYPFCRAAAAALVTAEHHCICSHTNSTTATSAPHNTCKEKL